MGIMEGKKGIIFGVSNKFGIANAIAEQIYKEGGEKIGRASGRERVVCWV